MFMGQVLIVARPPDFLLPLSSGLMNPIGRLGGGAGVASSAAIESASSAMLRSCTVTLRSSAWTLGTPAVASRRQLSAVDGGSPPGP